MSVKELITAKLTEAFNPILLEVTDDSHMHRGHAGARPGGESHFTVHIVAHEFAGKSPIQRHRMVHGVLDAELKGGVHALSIKAHSPGEPMD